MTKSFVRIEKIKNMGKLRARWNHDINKEFRKEHVSNADSSRIDSNDILVSCTDDDGFEISYDVAVKKRIQGLKDARGHNIRKDAVIAYDIILEFGDADDIEAEGINVDEWEKRSLEWLKETFNVAGDGKENVLSVVCHKDESSPHIHAIVSPVDERGCLCARSFTNGSAALSLFQDTYAEKLADLGIERGIKGSSAHHKSNRRYNAEKALAAKIPEPEPGQSAEEYLMVYQAELEARAVRHKVQMDKMERKLRAEMDEDRLLQREAINCKYRPDRAHCTEFQCIPSVSSVHAFRKAEQSFDLLNYKRTYLKNCVNGAFMPPKAMPLTQFLSIWYTFFGVL